jgi:hypothetical protein
MITPILQRALSERIMLAPAIRAPEIAWRDLLGVHGRVLRRRGQQKPGFHHALRAQDVRPLTGWIGLENRRK